VAQADVAEMHTQGVEAEVVEVDAGNVGFSTIANTFAIVLSADANKLQQLAR